MHIKSLAQRYPKLIHALLKQGINTGTAGDTLTCAVSGRNAKLTDVTNDVTLNADGTWTPNAAGGITATGTFGGPIPSVNAEKVYLGIICIGGATGAANNPTIQLGDTGGLNVVIGGAMARSGTSPLYTLTTHAPGNGEVSASLVAVRNSLTNREAYYKRWIKDAVSLAFNDSYGNGISAGALGTVPNGALGSGSLTFTFSCGVNTSFNYFAGYLFELDDMPSQADLDACVKFMSGSRGQLWSGCARWA